MCVYFDHFNLANSFLEEFAYQEPLVSIGTLWAHEPLLIESINKILGIRLHYQVPIGVPEDMDECL